MIKLNIGSNEVLIEGWQNIDIIDAPGVIQHDVRNGLPFEENSVDFIFSEHFIEHLDEPHGYSFFLECFRVLKEGGVVRTSTFSIDDILMVANKRDWDKFKEVYMDGAFKEKDRIDFLNLVLYEGGAHKHMYNDDEMKKFLKKAGFSKLDTPKWRKSKYKELQNLEWRGNSTCIVEAIK